MVCTDQHRIMVAFRQKCPAVSSTVVKLHRDLLCSYSFLQDLSDPCCVIKVFRLPGSGPDTINIEGCVFQSIVIVCPDRDLMFLLFINLLIS